MSTESKVIDWALERGIFDKASPRDQFVKLVEEVGEIAECLAKDKPLKDIELEIGDLGVTMILLAHMKGTSLEESLDAAYKKISSRTGKMVDGVFVKDGD